MELLDTTLREGEQCYGVFFTLDDKVRIARLLDELGVDFIEAGHPAAAPSLREAVRVVARLGLRAAVVGHARLDRREIRQVRDLGLAWVGLFSGINGLSLARYGLARRSALERAGNAIRYAKDLGLAVRFTCEDASRTEPGELLDLYGKAEELGVDRISFADTVGVMTPRRLELLSKRFGCALPFSRLHFHFHDDRGLALVNAARAAALGARCMDASVLGLGERAGLVDLEALLAFPACRRAAQSSLRSEALASVKELVSRSIDGQRYSRRRYAHKSGIHIHGVSMDPRQYEHAAPSAAAGKRLLVLSKLIGRAGLRVLLARCGCETDTAGFDRLFSSIKAEERLELAEQGEIKRYLVARGARLRTAANCRPAVSEIAAVR